MIRATPFPTEVLPQFLGVNLRRDGLSLADEEVALATNVDFHTILGTCSVRRGYAALTSITLPAAIRTLARHETRRYQAAGTVVYRNWVSLLTGLSSAVTTFEPMRPLNDTTTWTFIADANGMNKDNGSASSLWGIAPPLAAAGIAASAGAGALTGDYSARYTYIRKVGSSVAHESNPSAIVTALTLAAKNLEVTVVASLDTQVTHIRMYRTAAGGSTYLYDQEVANADATITSSQADSALGTAVETDNDRPNSCAVVAAHQEHLFLCQDASNPHYLWYSKRFRPESWPTSQFLEIGSPADPLQALVPLTGILGVFSRQTKYRVSGNGVSGFVAQEALHTRGVVHGQAVVPTSLGAVFVARDGLFATNFVGSDVELSQAIQALFYGETVNGYAPIDWAYPEALTLAEYKRRLYFGYRDTAAVRMLAVYSLDTQRWYFYQLGVSPARLLVEEETDLLTLGDTAGNTWQLETGTSAQTTTMQTAERAFSVPSIEKTLRWLSVDADAGWTVALRVDGTTVLTTTTSGARRRRFLQTPADTRGHVWDAVCTATGSGSLYSLEVMDSGPPDGQVWIQDPAASGEYLQILPGPQGFDAQTRKALRYLVVDLEVTTPGTDTWTLQLYVDGTVRDTQGIVTDRPHRLMALPAGLSGYTWHIVATYSRSAVPQLYQARILDTGAVDGQVLVRDPAALGQYLAIVPAQQPVNPFVLKRLRYLQLDADATSGTWTVHTYVDQVLRHTALVTGNRRHTRIHLPERLLGYTWHVEVTSSETPVPPVYGVLMHAQEMSLA